VREKFLAISGISLANRASVRGFSCLLARPKLGLILCLLLLLAQADVFGDVGQSSNSRGSITKRSQNYLAETTHELRRVLGYQPKTAVELEFVDLQQYASKVGKNSWAHAVYFNNKITIALRPELSRSRNRLRRLIRHETLHAAVDLISDSQCPAWFEEGLALLFEGGHKRALSRALSDYLRERNPISLHQLEVNFAGLDKPLAEVAYGQSYFAVQSLVHRFGFSGIRKYLSSLGAGRGEKGAFYSAFGMNLSEFEQQLGVQLKLWTNGGRDEF